MNRRINLSGHPSEDVEQTHLFDWLRITRWKGYPLVRWYFAIPNGGRRNLLEAVKLKRTGVKAGVHDVLGIIAVPPFHGHFVEMKAHGGRLSDEQKDFAEIAREQGYKADVCFGWHEATQAIERYLGRDSAVTKRG